MLGVGPNLIEDLRHRADWPLRRPKPSVARCLDDFPFRPSDFKRRTESSTLRFGGLETNEVQDVQRKLALAIHAVMEVV